MRTLLFAAVAALTLSSAFAQEFRGVISGVVADPTGARIGGAKVTVIETHTNAKSETVSDSSGAYTAPLPASRRL